MKELLLKGMILAGMGCVVHGAWLIWMPAGWIISGVALILVAYWST